MAKGELISVIIPVYEAEKTIKACLRSICQSVHRNLEIIVVYRKSKDNTLKIINSLDDERIRIINQEKDTGPGGARNIGLENASGEWAGFVEADDIIPNTFYSSLLSYSMQYGADVVCGEIVSNGKEWTIHKENKILKSFTEKFSLIENGACFDKLFRKEFLIRSNIRFMPSVRWEDNPFVFRAYYFANMVVTVPRVKYYYQPSKKFEAEKDALKKDILPVAKDILNFFENKDLDEVAMLLVKKKIVQSFARGYLEDSGVYKELMQCMEHPMFLRVIHYKEIFKIFKRALLEKLHLRKRKEKNK